MLYGVKGDGDDSEEGRGLKNCSSPGGISYKGVFSILNVGYFSEFIISLFITVSSPIFFFFCGSMFNYNSNVAI